jgi:hypothetical protein
MIAHFHDLEQVGVKLVLRAHTFTFSDSLHMYV